MSEVTVRVPTILRPKIGGESRVTVSPAESVREALNLVEQQHPGFLTDILDEDGAIKCHLNVFAGEQNIKDANGIDTATRSGGEITILTAVAGG